MTMREPNEYQEELRTSCEKCRDAFEQRIDVLTKINADLIDRNCDLEEQFAVADLKYVNLREALNVVNEARA